ncbi:MAG: CPBP family intramembrane metalloprotease [Chlamydiales bacterium]|nr:CPBP family intramembrane metalloprotease [Chlamydiales bacterium]
MKTLYAIIITTAITWAWIGAYFWWGGEVNSPLFPFFGATLMWIPGICALVIARREGFKLPIIKKPGMIELVAVLLCSFLVSMSIILSFPFATFAPMALGWDSLSAILITTIFLGATINGIAALGEELFWRGYLHEKLKYLGIVRASLIIGTAWGIWHAPIILMGYNYPTHEWLGVVMMTLITISISPIQFFLREESGAIMAPAIFHGVFNAMAGLAFLVYTKPDTLFVGATGIVGFVFFSIASWVILKYYAKKIAT